MHLTLACCCHPISLNEQTSYLSDNEKDTIIAIYHPILSPILHLFRLTLHVKGKLSNAYSMGESVEDAFQRYLARLVKLEEKPEDVVFVDGDLADPHAHPHQ